MRLFLDEFYRYLIAKYILRVVIKKALGCYFLILNIPLQLYHLDLSTHQLVTNPTLDMEQTNETNQ